MVVHDRVGKEKVLPKEVEVISSNEGSDGSCVQTVQVEKNKDTSLVCCTITVDFCVIKNVIICIVILVAMVMVFFFKTLSTGSHSDQ